LRVARAQTTSVATFVTSVAIFVSENENVIQLVLLPLLLLVFSFFLE